MALSILIVDDSKVMRSVIRRILDMCSMDINELYEASNGKEALDILGKNLIDLILADLNMPVMDGVEMIERMSDDGLLKTIPVIVVSTDGSETRIEELKSKGVRAFIRKPFTPEIIISVISDVTGVGSDS